MRYFKSWQIKAKKTQQRRKGRKGMEECCEKIEIKFILGRVQYKMWYNLLPYSFHHFPPPQGHLMSVSTKSCNIILSLHFSLLIRQLIVQINFSLIQTHPTNTINTEKVVRKTTHSTAHHHSSVPS